jgi:protoheme IX farnesyltransferase
MGSPTDTALDSTEPLDGAVDAAHGRRGNLWMDLTKARLNGLVLLTTAAGVVLAEPYAIEWTKLAWTMLGTGLAAASAAMLNQLLERRRDALMHRTAGRPLPSGRISGPLVAVLGIATAYLGVAVLVLQTNALAGALALANVLLYVLVYTPLKPRTTLNTLVGAICGGIPPMIGWAAVRNDLEAGAWTLGAILFVWQIPHFLALAWMYREDYRRGGMSMLPVVDPQGEITGRVMVLSSLLLVPLGLAATHGGLAGYWSALVATIAAVGLAAASLRFYFARSDASARTAFFASILYLPLVLGAMVVDRGAVNAEAYLRSRNEAIGATLPESAAPPPVNPHGGLGGVP